MAATIGTIVAKPWEADTGYPLDLFTQQVQGKLLDQRSLFCARKECGSHGRVLRDPYHAPCGHRFCEECINIIRSESRKTQREPVCNACKQERLEDNAVQDHSNKRQRASVENVLGNEKMDMGVLDDDENTQGSCKLDLNNTMVDPGALKDIQKLQVNCPNKCGTSEQLLIRTLEQHMEKCSKSYRPPEYCTTTEDRHVYNNRDGDTACEVASASLKRISIVEDTNPTPSKRSRVTNPDNYDISDGKGLVAIINNFVQLREGTWEDEVSIVRTYSMQPFKDHYELYGYELLPGHRGTSLEFGNKHNKDLGKRAMNDYLDKLKQYLKDNKDKYSSVTLFVLSHGNENGVIPYYTGSPEDAIAVADIMKRFEEVLTNKPKTIVIQACKGLARNTALEVDYTECTQQSQPPRGSDMLVAYATVNGYAAFRDRTTGTLYIQTLIATMKECCQSEHLCDILTKVNEKVAGEVLQWPDRNTGVIRKVRQMPYHSSALRRKLFLLP